MGPKLPNFPQQDSKQTSLSSGTQAKLRQISQSYETIQTIQHRRKTESKSPDGQPQHLTEELQAIRGASGSGMLLPSTHGQLPTVSSLAHSRTKVEQEKAPPVTRKCPECRTVLEENQRECPLCSMISVVHRSFLRPEDEKQGKVGMKRSSQRDKQGAKNVGKTPLHRTSGAQSQVSQRTLVLLGLLTLTGIAVLVLWRVMG